MTPAFRIATKEEARVPAGEPGAGEWVGNNSGGGDGKTISNDEERAIGRYQQGGYFSVNESLREATVPDAETADRIKLIDSAMAKQDPITEPLTVYRKMEFPSDDAAAAFVASPPGSFTDKGFVSTSRADMGVGTNQVPFAITLPVGRQGRSED